MISCPAAKQIRWVKPSMATESPSRTSSPTASRIEETFEAVAIRSLSARRRRRSGRLGCFRACFVRADGPPERLRPYPPHVDARFLEDAKSRRDLRQVDDERRGHPDHRIPGPEDQRPPQEAGDLDGVGRLGVLELDTDHEPRPRTSLTSGCRSAIARSPSSKAVPARSVL